MSICRILVVEDHPFQRHCLLSQLHQIADVSVDAVADGVEALERLRQRHYDLIISDLMMPNLDGVQLIQKLAALDYKPALALMSTLPERMLHSASQVARFAGFKVVALHCKPLSMEALRKMIHRPVQAPPALASPPAPHLSCDRRQLVMALRKRQMQAWFQPKMCLRRGRIVAAEALVRWEHPEHGVLLPGEFLPALEQFRLERGLLRVVIQQTVLAQRRWRRQGHKIRVSINLPTHLLNDSELADRVLKQVKSEGGEARDIIFELMEDSTTHNQGNYYANACRLRFKGFGLAQDDFGSGYSSYCNLASTPYSELKIDRSLIHGCLDNRCLTSTVGSIVALGRQLGLTVVAEGVETEQELAFLRRLECHQVQGHLISPALPLRQFERLLDEQGGERN
ncbi:EAL domain-containing protein [Pseudomonas sp. dw_358]|uniref:EAL domain-containing response regulator n=1 Tax=Pseudomonas sp. dw_358 TaxID=2720083 RepID=UPI001BD37E11|nr:EAL domain-containing protein [Pseudomonas sp. dw_358]